MGKAPKIDTNVMARAGESDPKVNQMLVVLTSGLTYPPQRIGGYKPEGLVTKLVVGIWTKGRESPEKVKLYHTSNIATVH